MKHDVGSGRRRNVLSNPKAQLKIIAIFAVLGALFAGTNYYVSKMALHSLYSGVASLPLSAANSADVSLWYEQQNATLAAQLVLLTTLCFVVLTLGGLFLSHVIVGPIHRLTVYLNAAAKRKVQPHKIILRKRDFFHELAGALNAFQESLGMLSGSGKDKAESEKGDTT